MAKAILRKTRETRVRSGHPWIYSSEIERVEGDVANGDIIDVCNFRGTFIARGFYNANSQITIRILTHKDEVCDKDFFRARIESAWEYRKRFCDPDSCRLIFSESDFMPGLVVDKFDDVLVMQALSLGMDRIKDDLCDILMDVVSPRSIYERDDVPVRRLEGLEQKTGLLRGEVPDRVYMKENGLTFCVDVKEGQKTGFFLDQKQNRRAIAPLCPGARACDCFCHNGAFALNAAQYGAKEVTAVDISADALTVAKENARLNGIENVDFVEANCFDWLREKTDANEKFDLVILDPPAFAKNKAAVEKALKGYKEINIRGMKLTRSGGFLVTCSCSQHVTPDLFKNMINEAARDCKKRIRYVENRSQAQDHPILPISPETEYLKCSILQVFD